LRIDVKLPIVCLAILLVTIIPIHAELPNSTPSNIEVLTYSDGVADVSISYQIDPTQAKASIQLIGYQYQTILVQDQDGLILDYTLQDKNMTVDTLGSTNINVSYTTPSLTSKSGTVWTINFTSPITTSITLPQGSTIVNLSSLPIEIKTVQDRPQLLLIPGNISIIYINDIYEPRSSALNALSNAQNYVNAIKEEGIKAPEADALLIEAQKAFENQDYTEAIKVAAQAERSADLAKSDFLLSSTQIEEASHSIEDAKIEQRTSGLDEAESLLHEASEDHENGEYDTAYTKALEAEIMANKAIKPPNNLPVYLGALVIVIIVITMFYIRSKKGPIVKSIKKQETKVNEIDLDMIFQNHRNLRMDDKEVIRFIVQSGGELFANEIRERFDLPRTSAWRLIRRLKGFGILEERKVGGQSLVSISRRYRK
jgi:uncharacterized membrane protein